MNDAPLRLYPRGGEPAFELDSPRLVVAGYTGRDQAAVAEHIAELAAIGVPPPDSVPTFYDLDPALLTTDAVVEVDGAVTSGEVEPVLIRHAGRLYLGVGSDHTDRDLERDGVGVAKAACPKPLGPQVLALPAEFDALDWDGIRIEATVDGALYQHGTLTAIRTPEDLLARLGAALGEIDSDLVLFSGTVPLLGGEFVPGVRWQLTLTTGAGVALSHSYDVKRRSA